MIETMMTVLKTRQTVLYYQFRTRRIKYNPQVITTARPLYFSGKPLRNTARSLKLLGVDIGRHTICKWIEKYTLLMEAYIEQVENLIENMIISRN